MTQTTRIATAIALNRFGLGARPDDASPGEPEKFLKAQFERFVEVPPAFAALPDAAATVRDYLESQRALRRASRMSGPGESAPASPEPSAALASEARPKRTAEQIAARKNYVQAVRGAYRQAVQARMNSALATDAPFIERLVHFWSNHFCVSVDNPQVTALAGVFERDAIRPHVLGRFEDMLMAVEQHPAMLIYLNQAQSIGPNSIAAQRNAWRGPRRRGLNENLAREIMELHTLGVRSGYGQGDVTEFARALTGWSVGGLAATDPPGEPAGFRFRRFAHEPGVRTILGRAYPQEGEAQARAVLADFARAPQTATHVATKLARHFAGDAPPPALVARLATAFRRSGGDLPAIYAVLVDSPECWAPAPVKFKTPWEWTVSALRGLGRRDVGEAPIQALEQQLGQPVWKPGSPAGWDDVAASWAAPDALLRRVQAAQRMVAPMAGTLDARALAPRILPGALQPATEEQIARAESPATALALLLVSPEFMRR